MHVFILTDCVNGDERFCLLKMANKRSWSQHKAFITVWVYIDFVTGNILTVLCPLCGFTAVR